MSDAQPLPPRPHLDRYRTLARDLQRACASSDPHAVRQWALRWLETLARLQAFDPTPSPEQLGREAERIDRRWRASNDRKDDPPCRLANALFFVAREHGFASWPKFSAHVKALDDALTPVARFEAAVDAIVRGDAATLRRLLRDDPALVRARSSREHESTLLHYVSANGVEDFRQVTPPNIVEIATLLLDAGAEVDAVSNAYGGGSTTLGLAATSIHPQAAGVQIPLLEALLARGARIEQPGLAGNEHSAVWGCLANGQPEAAEFFAARGARLSFEEAAGLGRVETLRTFVDERGAIAGVPQDRIAAALRYAAGYGRVETVQFLLAKGADPGAAEPDGQTALHWATFGPHVEAAQALLHHGAPVDARDATYQATPLAWAIFNWAKRREPSKCEACYTMIALLVQAGGTFDPEMIETRAGEALRADSRMQAILGGG